MIRKLTMILMSALLVTGLCVQAADKGNAGSGPSAQDPKAKLVTEADFAKWLVNVLGLSRALPASPSAQECFAALMQNGIAPKQGWKENDVVTMGTLARVVTQSLHRQADVKNQEDDNSGIQFLKSIGIEFGTIGQAMDTLGPIDPAYVGEAAVVTTDPLNKKAKMNPQGEQQFGADLQPVSPTIVVAPVTIEQTFQQAANTIVLPPPAMTSTGPDIGKIIGIWLAWRYHFGPSPGPNPVQAGGAPVSSASH